MASFSMIDVFSFSSESEVDPVPLGDPLDGTASGLPDVSSQLLVRPGDVCRRAIRNSVDGLLYGERPFLRDVVLPRRDMIERLRAPDSIWTWESETAYASNAVDPLACDGNVQHCEKRGRFIRSRPNSWRTPLGTSLGWRTGPVGYDPGHHSETPTMRKASLATVRSIPFVMDSKRVMTDAVEATQA